MAPHSSTLAWKIPWTEEPGRLQSMALLESDTTEQLHFHFSLSCIGEGNGNPLQYSCLENPGMGKPGGLPSMGSHRVGHDWSGLAAAAAQYRDFQHDSSENVSWMLPCVLIWSLELAMTWFNGRGMDARKSFNLLIFIISSLILFQHGNSEEI